MSEKNRRRVFELAEQLGRFRGDFEYMRGKVAAMGAKTLTWAGPEGRYQSTFNYTVEPGARELAELFIHISNVFDARRRLEYRRRFDKLGLEGDLRSLEEMQKKNQLAELAAIAPVLRNIANDFTVMRIARLRATRLLQAAGLEAPSGGPAASQNP